MDNNRTYRGYFISDFNMGNLAGYLENDPSYPPVTIEQAPYGQVIEVLMDDERLGKAVFDFIVVWTRPESVIPACCRIFDFQTVDTDEIIGEVDAFAEHIVGIGQKTTCVIVPTWSNPLSQRGWGPLDMKTGHGIANTLMRMNLRLAEVLEKHPNIFVPNAARWIVTAGKNAFSDKLWYMGKIPFGAEVFEEAAKDIKSLLRGLEGRAKKLIVLDLDDTLWGGIVGEVGWENLRLGGHDHIGEAYVDFQKALKALKNRGIILGIASKNEESVALEAIKKHPEMVLKPDDFAGWKINWSDKAQNIADLAADINIGIDAAVFIDNDPVERARVREALPEVYVPDWPGDTTLFRSTLLGLRCFDTTAVSEEDARRSEMYATERKREAVRKRVGSIDDWFGTLGIIVQVEELTDKNLLRTVQLINKTNQMNLATRRMTEIELTDWTREENHILLIFRVRDKYGDSGLTGILSLDIRDATAEIVDFVLSCRVMGRKIEETMVFTAIECARSLGLETVRAEYLPTEKNKPCLEFWKRSGFKSNKAGTVFTYHAGSVYPKPNHITIESG